MGGNSNPNHVNKQRNSNPGLNPIVTQVHSLCACKAAVHGKQIFPLAGLTKKCPNSSWEQLSPFLPGGAGTGSPCSLPGAQLSPGAAPPGQGQPVPGWQQMRQSYVRTRNLNPNSYSSTVHPVLSELRGFGCCHREIVRGNHTRERCQLKSQGSSVGQRSSSLTKREGRKLI